jgi:Alw26I/Eco31I/Esp3I family type II restriction m6 adenine DNA methyltransferase
MNYSKEDFKSLFQAKFDYSKWFVMLKDFFKADELRTTAEPITDPADCDKGYYIGAINTSDSYRIGLFYYEIGNSNVARKKVGLRNLVRTFINPNWGQFDAALAVFSDDNQWRLSLISDIKGEATAAKRFTFVFGEKDNLYRTAIERFALIRSEGVSFEVLKKAFSVEALSEEFFNLYKDHYERFCDFIYQHAENENYFGPEFAEWNSHEDSQKHIRDYVKNLMGRIVFLQFLQKKGWMGVSADRNDWVGGDLYFMQHLFDYATKEQREDFLDQVLEPLFFNCLNTLRPNDEFDTNIKGIGLVKIPYLNGELFEQKEVDKAKSRFPQKYFHDLLNLFSQYNFTIDENDPNDAEIGVDPEMLGKIFENLLEDNKDKGAFYTPKEIVSYMCKESLISYLCTHVAAKYEEAIKTLVNSHQLTDKLQEDVNTCKRLNKYLQDVKVCDPAIGSGAFPMGVMNEIFSCRRVLHDNIEEEVTAETQAQIKRDIIQNNIYGVDIEQGAVDIARLRFWLALVVDSVQPEPLPNLDYKIMQGNSLMESYRGLDLSNLLHSDDLFVSTKAQELPKLLRGYYHETNNDAKQKLRQQIDFTIKQCIFLAGYHDKIEIPNTLFFLWHTYFQEVFKDGGFDIVIGNPPYFLYQGSHKNEIPSLKKISSLKIAFGGKLNAYKLFLAKALNDLAKENGIVTYIFQNSFLADKQAANLRKEIIKKSHILVIDSFPERDSKKKRVFESVKMSVCIAIIQKALSDNAFRINIWNDKNKSSGISTSFTKEDIISIDPVFNTIPRIEQKNLPIAKKINTIPKRIELKCFEGELNMTVHRPFFNQDIEQPKVLKGASIQRYFWTENMSQGIIEHVDSTKYISSFKKSEKVHHHEVERIAMQGMTGANDKIRLIATIVPKNVFLANSCNYILKPEKCSLQYVLGLFNSKLMNWYFRCFSTNSNVNGYEVDAFPIIDASEELKNKISALVAQILSLKQQNASQHTDEIEDIIDLYTYHLYNLSYDDVLTIDPQTPITKEEYEA